MAMLSKSSSEASRLQSHIGFGKLSEGMVPSDESFNMPYQYTGHVQVVLVPP